MMLSPKDRIVLPELSFRITSVPPFTVEPKETSMEHWVEFEPKFTAMPAELRLLEVRQNSAETVSFVEVTIREGKFHQVKRMFEAVGKKVLTLQRISMGPLVLDRSLPEGEARPLTEEEIKALLSLS